MNEIVKNETDENGLLAKTYHTDEIECQASLLDKFISETLTNSEKEIFESHLDECEFCLDFVYERKIQLLSKKLEVELEFGKIISFLTSIKEEVNSQPQTFVATVGSSIPQKLKRNTVL